MHSAGWLEAGLVSCYEKFIVDIEILRMLKHEFTPLEIDEASLAFGAHEEVGPGGHFLGAAHTLERFRECFYRPLLSSTENFERWKRKGGLDATARAEVIWRRDAGGVRAAAARRGDPRGARRSTSIAAGPSWATDHGIRTAAPSIPPLRTASSAASASSSAKVVTCVRTGTRGARSRNSTASARVRLATERSVRSPQSSS